MESQPWAITDDVWDPLNLCSNSCEGQVRNFSSPILSNSEIEFLTSPDPSYFRGKSPLNETQCFPFSRLTLGEDGWSSTGRARDFDQIPLLPEPSHPNDWPPLPKLPNLQETESSPQATLHSLPLVEQSEASICQNRLVDKSSFGQSSVASEWAPTPSLTTDNGSMTSESRSSRSSRSYRSFQNTSSSFKSARTPTHLTSQGSHTMWEDKFRGDRSQKSGQDLEHSRILYLDTPITGVYPKTKGRTLRTPGIGRSSAPPEERRSRLQTEMPRSISLSSNPPERDRGLSLCGLFGICERTPLHYAAGLQGLDYLTAMDKLKSELQHLPGCDLYIPPCSSNAEGRNCPESRNSFGQLGYLGRRSGEICALSNSRDGEPEAISRESGDDSASISMEDEVETIIGPGKTHLTQQILKTLRSWSFSSELFLHDSDFRQSPSGTGNTPASSSSQGTGNNSSPSTSSSGYNNGKRKAPAGGDEGDQANGGDGNDGEDKGRSPKIAKIKPIATKWDCPLSRGPISPGMAQHPHYSLGCTPNGLEFRHVWEHLRRAHYGCETCGLRLDRKNADKNHLRAREKDPSICRPDCNGKSDSAIGIDLFMQMEEIYDDKKLSNHQQNWAEWWKLLFPKAPIIPDGLHHGTISVSSGDIPRLQHFFASMWYEEAGKTLPQLSERQMLTVLSNFEKTIKLCHSIHRQRRKIQSPAQQTLSIGVTTTPMPSQHENAQLILGNDSGGPFTEQNQFGDQAMSNIFDDQYLAAPQAMDDTGFDFRDLLNHEIQPEREGAENIA